MSHWRIISFTYPQPSTPAKNKLHQHNNTLWSCFSHVLLSQQTITTGIFDRKCFLFILCLLMWSWTNEMRIEDNEWLNDWMSNTVLPTMLPVNYLEENSRIPLICLRRILPFSSMLVIFFAVKSPKFESHPFTKLIINQFRYLFLQTSRKQITKNYYICSNNRFKLNILHLFEQKN